MRNSSAKDAVPAATRLQSLDAYRGLIMISLAFVGFGLAGTADNYLQQQPDSDWWQGVKYQFSHAQWVGCSYWDMIQPSFMFMVGVSMPFSYARRQERGDSYHRMLRHAITRSVVLVGLSIFLMSMWGKSTNWIFTNVLAQIGLGYTFLFLLWNRSVRVQLGAAFAILAAVWIGYESYPAAGITLSQGAPEVGVSAEWAQQNLQGIRSAWHKNANLGQAIDASILNFFPRDEPWTFSQGGYHTINFVPSIVTMLFGLMCGELLRSDLSNRRKLNRLILAGIAGLLGGSLLGGFLIESIQVCPIVKRIWTPTWTLFSTGWCCLILACLYAVIDILQFKRWSFPLVVVGMNSIAIYCMSMTLKPWVARQLETHFGSEIFTLYGTVSEAVSPSVQAILVGSCFWLVCWWMYRQRIFIRI